MPRKDEIRKQLIFDAPFSDMLSLVASYNEEYESQLSLQITDIIQTYIIPQIRCDNLYEIEQAILLAGCANYQIVKLLFQSLLDQLNQNKVQQNCPELFDAIISPLCLDENHLLNDEDKNKCIELLLQRENTIYAIDLHFTCYTLFSYYMILCRIISNEQENIDCELQKSNIFKTLTLLSNNLAKTTTTSSYEINILNNLKKAIEFLNVLLQTPLINKKVYLFKIKVAALLLLQALGSDIKWHGASDFSLDKGVSALGAAYSFINQAIKFRAVTVQDINSNYFSDLVVWIKSLEVMLVSNHMSKIKTHIKKLKESSILSTNHSSIFIVSILKVLLLLSSEISELRNSIVGFFLYCLDFYTNEKTDFYKPVVQLICFGILKIFDENGENLSRVLISNLTQKISLMNEEDKFLYKDYQRSKQITMQVLYCNLSKMAWNQLYEGDVKLYDIFLSMSQDNCIQLNDKQINDIRTLKTSIISDQFSKWGKLLLDTFEEEEINNTILNAKLKAVVTQNLIAVEVGLTYDDIKNAVNDPCLLTSIIQMCIKEGNKNIPQLSEEQKKVLGDKCDHAIKRIFELTPATVAEIHYYSDVIGCRIMSQKNNKIIDEGTITYNDGMLHSINAKYSAEIGEKLKKDISQEYNMIGTQINIFPPEPPPHVKAFRNQLSKDPNNVHYQIELGAFPILTSNFVGRRRELDLIGNALNEQPLDSWGVRRQWLVKHAIVGAGGIGKSQLVAKYFVDSKDKYNIIIWLNAKPEHIETEFQLLANQLGIVLKLGVTLSEVKKAIYELLGNVRRTLFVFSGVKDASSIKDYLPIEELYLPKNEDNLLHCIITSEYTDWQSCQFSNDSIFQLEYYNDEEVKDYLYNAFKTNFSLPLLNQLDNQLINNFISLAIAVGRLPLAISQAAAFINNTKNNANLGSQITSYINSFNIDPEQFLTLHGAIINEVDKNILSTLKVTIEYLKLEVSTKKALEAAFYCAYLADDIPFNFLQNCFEVKETELISRLYCLKSFSLAYVNFNKRVVNFNPLTKIVLRYWLKNQIEENNYIYFKKNNYMCGLLFGYIVFHLKEELRKVLNYKNRNIEVFEQAKAFVPHIKQWILNAPHELDFSIGQLSFELALHFYYRAGEPANAIAYILEALPIYEKYYGKYDKKIIMMLEDIGNMYRALGNFQQSLIFLSRSLNVQKTYYKEKYQRQLSYTLNNLGNTLFDNNQFEQAKQCFQQSLEIKQKLFGDYHISLAAPLNNLGNVYRCLDGYISKELYEKALVITMDYYGMKHIEVAKPLVGLSMAYGCIGNMEKKIELLLAAFIMYEFYYGKEHEQFIKLVGDFLPVYLKFSEETKNEMLEGSLSNIKAITEWNLLNQEIYKIGLQFTPLACAEFIRLKTLSYNNTSNCEINIAIGDLLFSCTKCKAAISYYQLAISKNINCGVTTYCKLAHCYKLIGETSFCYKIYNKMTKLYLNALGYVDYAHFLWKEGKKEKALEMINKCLDCDNKEEEISYIAIERSLMEISLKFFVERYSCITLTANSLGLYLKFHYYFNIKDDKSAKEVLTELKDYCDNKKGEIFRDLVETCQWQYLIYPPQNNQSTDTSNQNTSLLCIK